MYRAKENGLTFEYVHKTRGPPSPQVWHDKELSRSEVTNIEQTCLYENNNLKRIDKQHLTYQSFFFYFVMVHVNPKRKALHYLTHDIYFVQMQNNWFCLWHTMRLIMIIHVRQHVNVWFICNICFSKHVFILDALPVKWSMHAVSKKIFTYTEIRKIFLNNSH